MSKKILKADFVLGYVIRDVNLLYWNKRIAVMKKGKKMERYKVILVDDEAEVIDMIEKKIHWNDLGFEVAGSATNGVKALDGRVRVIQKAESGISEYLYHALYGI